MINLHCHSIYSVLDSILTPEDIAKEGAKEGAIALTDHGTFAGHPLFGLECKKNNVKPIYGVETYVRYNKDIFHLTVLPINNDGYKDLLRISSLNADNTSKNTIIPITELSNISENLIILTGCSGGLVVKQSTNIDSSLDILHKFTNLFGTIYVEIQPNDDFLHEYHILCTTSGKVGLPIVITSDVHYPNKEDVKIYENLYKINYKRSPGIFFKHMYFWEDQELFNYFKQNDFDGDIIISGIKNTYEVADQCNVELSYERKWKFDADPKEVMQICYDKLVSLGLQNNTTYLKRLSQEFAVFKELELLGYLNFCREILQYCKSNRIPYGPGRGSCVGSLVCYLLDITEIDPIIGKLSFERFLAPNVKRGILPEIS